MKNRKLLKREQFHQGIELWNRRYPELTLRSQLIEQNIFAPFSGVAVQGWALYKKGEMIAFAVGKTLTKEIYSGCTSDQGWLSLLLTDQKNVDYLQQFILEIENELKEQGVNKLKIGGDPQNFFPGLPEIFSTESRQELLAIGYEPQNREYDLYQNLDDCPLPSYLEKTKEKINCELQLKKVNKNNEELLMDFLASNFPGRWYYEADNIRRIPGGVEDYRLLWKEKKEVIGFLRLNRCDSSYQGPNVNWGHLHGEKYCGMGPLGIAKEHRGQGYSYYMLLKAMEEMKEKGYNQMMVDWTRLLEYYQRLGFKQFMAYQPFTKMI